MDKTELDRLVMEGFRPEAGPDEVSEIVATSIEPFRNADWARRNIGLYALERYVLTDQGDTTLTFGSAKSLLRTARPVGSAGVPSSVVTGR